MSAPSIIMNLFDSGLACRVGRRLVNAAPGERPVFPPLHELPAGLDLKEASA